MYAWTRPRIAIPVHGEDMHLAEHAIFARQQGVEEVVKARNGTMVRLAPGRPQILDNVPSGRLYKDGDILIEPNDRLIPERRKLAFAGVVSIAIALDRRGAVAGEPVVEMMGLPGVTRRGDSILDLVAETVASTIDGLSREKRRDATAVENAVDRAVRSAVGSVWGKKPACHVLVIEV
jgi:ribonuclease J